LLIVVFGEGLTQENSKAIFRTQMKIIYILFSLSLFLGSYDTRVGKLCVISVSPKGINRIPQFRGVLVGAWYRVLGSFGQGNNSLESAEI